MLCSGTKKFIIFKAPYCELVRPETLLQAAWASTSMLRYDFVVVVVVSVCVCELHLSLRDVETVRSCIP